MTDWLEYPEHRHLKFFPFFYNGIFSLLTASLNFSEIYKLIMLNTSLNEILSVVGKSLKNTYERYGLEPGLQIAVLVGVCVLMFGTSFWCLKRPRIKDGKNGKRGYSSKEKVQPEIEVATESSDGDTF